jgi:hypothetical protein
MTSSVDLHPPPARSIAALGGREGALFTLPPWLQDALEVDTHKVLARWPTAW